MPRPRQRRRRARRNKKRIYGTKATFMPKTLALERFANVSTKTFYFKKTGVILPNAAGVTQFDWRTIDSTGVHPIPAIPSDFRNVSALYTEYKCLAIRVKLFAANVGTESAKIGTTPALSFFARGNTVLYCDQDIKDNEPLPSVLTDVMNYGSTRMIASRADKHTRVIYRAKNHPNWGTCDLNIPIADRPPDSWNGGLFLLGTGASPTGQSLWYYTASYKVVFRGRNYTT